MSSGGMLMFVCILVSPSNKYPLDHLKGDIEGTRRGILKLYGVPLKPVTYSPAFILESRLGCGLLEVIVAQERRCGFYRGPASLKLYGDL